jgi:choline dehydrogenase-like flavoprotein
MRVLSEEQGAVLRDLCDLIVPGSARVWPEVYIDAVAARMHSEDQAGLIACIAELADARADAALLGSRAATPAFGLIRALAAEAFYSDFVAPGAAADGVSGAYEEIDFTVPLAARVKKDWSYLLEPGAPADGRNSPGMHRNVQRSAHYEVIVVGSGAGGGIIAAEVAESGRSVLLLEAGPLQSAAQHQRWEARANHEIWFPFDMAFDRDGEHAPLPLLRGRCVGGTTTVNTKVALRPGEEDYRKWFAAGGLLGDGGEPFGEADLLPYIERVEARLDVRVRDDWGICVRTVQHAFEQLGAPLGSVVSYTDPNCYRCGSCLQGCPTNAGKSTLNSYIRPATQLSGLELEPDAFVDRIVIEDRGGGPVATGVQWTDGGGGKCSADADIVVVAGGALATPGILLRSGVPDHAGHSPSSELIGQTLGFHFGRLVEGIFDEIQDAHDVYPITAHSMQRMRDADGGYIVEAATIQDPIGFAIGASDECDTPLWGQELVNVCREYRHTTGLLTMVNDENNGHCTVDAGGRDRYSFALNGNEKRRIADSVAFAQQVLRRAGARRIVQTNIYSTHAQGSCRMGSDPARSVVDAHAESHDIRRLFIGDGSIVPRTLSVNPSLTIMALAARTAEYISANEHGYFTRAGEPVAAESQSTRPA